MMAETLPPLPIETEHWRSRWLVDRRWNALHRISSIKWDVPDEMISGVGVAVCGRKRTFRMPGLLSRLWLKRCPECCKALGIPTGEGAPFNAFDGQDIADV